MVGHDAALKFPQRKTNQKDKMGRSLNLLADHYQRLGVSVVIFGFLTSNMVFLFHHWLEISASNTVY